MLKNISLLVAAVFLFTVMAGCDAIGPSDTTTTTHAVATTTTAGATTTTTSSATTTTVAGSHALVGTWVGPWEDTVYMVQGSLSGTIVQAGSTLTGGGTIDLSGIGFPGISVEAGSAAGTISGGNVTFTFTSLTVGGGQGTITGNTIVGTGEVTGAMNFGGFTFVGTIDASGNSVSGIFDFTAPAGGAGVATVTKL